MKAIVSSVNYSHSASIYPWSAAEYGDPVPAGSPGPIIFIRLCWPSLRDKDEKGGRCPPGGDLLLARCKDTEYSWDTSFQNRPNGAPPMSAIFLSYRRADAEGHAGRLWDRLRLWFDPEALFYDQGRIDSGDVFPEEIKQALDSARVVLVLIAPGWRRILGERAEEPGIDWVRREVEIALERRLEPGGPRVIPVLLGGTESPSAETLPESLRSLCELEAHRFIGKDADWQAQFERLCERLAAIPGIPAPRFRLPSGQAQPFRVIEQLLSPHFQDPHDRLGELRTALESAGKAAVVARAALYGMGGVGKTQLALKYSHAFRHAYAGVWWFRAEDPASVEIDALACCTECGVAVPEGSRPSVALKRWVAGQPSWLLVYDNAEDVEAVRGFLPDGGRHHLLITSRNPAWGGLARPVSLETWKPEQGADFLAARLPDAKRGALLALAATLGGLPLALEQAAAFIEETGMAVEAYRAEAERIDTAGLILDEGRAATGYERSVLATLSIAFGRLSAEAAQLLRLCAFFFRRANPRALLPRAGRLPRGALGGCGPRHPEVGEDHRPVAPLRLGGPDRHSRSRPSARFDRRAHRAGPDAASAHPGGHTPYLMRSPGGLPRPPVRAVAGLSGRHQVAGPLAALRQPAAACAPPGALPVGGLARQPSPVVAAGPGRLLPDRRPRAVYRIAPVP